MMFKYLFIKKPGNKRKLVNKISDSTFQQDLTAFFHIDIRLSQNLHLGLDHCKFDEPGNLGLEADLTLVNSLVFNLKFTRFPIALPFSGKV